MDIEQMKGDSFELFFLAQVSWRGGINQSIILPFQAILCTMGHPKFFLPHILFFC